MRSLFYSLLSLATLASAVSAAPTAATATDDLDEVVPDTVFNGQTVPPMKELDSVKIEEDISKGYWCAIFPYQLLVPS